ncbi:DUF1499 domain-containing protein [Alsobacter sp. R-9]
MRWLTLAFVAALALAGLSLALRDRPFGIERVWSALFGNPDLGPVDFTRIVRRSTPNDALACPPGLCGTAAVDIMMPAYDLPFHALRERLLALVAAEPGAVRVAEAGGGRGDRFVVRTPLMRYPDTVDIMVLPAEGGRSTAAIYSRSQLGRSDLGANIARIRRWLDDPALKAAQAKG